MAATNDSGSIAPWTWFYVLLGSIFSSFALVSLTQKVLRIGVVPVMQQIIDYYRHLVHPAMHWALTWVNWVWPDWSIPSWLKDAYALSFVLGFSLARGIIFGPRGDHTSGERYAAIVLGAFLGASGLSLIIFLSPLMMIDAKSSDPDFYNQNRLAVVSALLAAGGAAGFFAVNSQM